MQFNGKVKFDPRCPRNPCEPMAIKLGMSDEVGDLVTHAKCKQCKPLMQTLVQIFITIR